MSENTKQIIVFRKDLLKGDKSIRKGKFAAQCCHASLGALLQLFSKTEVYDAERNSDEAKFVGTEYKVIIEPNSFLDNWLNKSFTKICLGVENDEELVALYDRIKQEAPEIPCVLITDSGRTEFHDVPTHTCIGIGPFDSEVIDRFTSHLSLL